MFDAELDAFKSQIDLRAYAASQGYTLDKKESWRGSAVMRHPNGDKIIIKRGGDNRYVFFSVRDDSDNGTIIDFAQKRLKMSLGAIRKELRPWLGLPPVPLPAFPTLERTSRDRLKVEAAWSKMRDALHHAYLENERAIPGSLLHDVRFAGRIRIDDRSNAIFPHFDIDGLCGYEIKNTNGFTGFASGGSKGLWLSRTFDTDRRLVLTESAIDALSHAVLFPAEDTRYASIGGKLNPNQPELIRSAIARMPAGSEIIAAMDADADGAKLSEIVRKAHELSGRGDLRFTRQEPFGSKDWNDQLRASPCPALPAPHKAAPAP